MGEANHILLIFMGLILLMAPFHLLSVELEAHHWVMEPQVTPLPF